MRTSRLILLLVVCLFACTLSAQTVDSRLHGQWQLKEVIEFTPDAKSKVSKRIAGSDSTQLRKYPVKLWTLIYMFDDYVGVSTTEGDLEYPSINLKGRFHTESNQKIFLRMYQLDPMNYTYELKGEETLGQQLILQADRIQLIYIRTHEAD